MKTTHYCYLAAGEIHLYPDTCTLVQADPKAAINVLFACNGVN